MTDRATPLPVNPLQLDGESGEQRSDHAPEINPLRVTIASAAELTDDSVAALRDAMVVLVDTRLSPVVAAALSGGSPSARIFRNGAEVALALSQDESLQTEDLIGVRAAGQQREYVIGGVASEPRDPTARLEAQKRDAEQTLQVARLALLNRKHNMGGDLAGVEAADAELSRHQRRLAAINAQLSTVAPSQQTAIEAARRRREVDAAMECFWRDSSYRSFERDVRDKPLAFASGPALYETIAALDGRCTRLVLASATNLAAVRRCAQRWWEDAAVPLSHFQPNPTGRGVQTPNDRLVLLLPPTHGGAGGETSSSDEEPSVCGMISAILTFQLMQLGEVELEEEDHHTRGLVQPVVRAASAGSSGWRDIEAKLQRALQREQAERGERSHSAEQVALLHFNRHAIVPERHQVETAGEAYGGLAFMAVVGR